MAHLFKILCIFFVFPFYCLAQKTSNPSVEKSTQKEVTIKSVEIKENQTEVVFQVEVKSGSGHYIFLSPPGSANAMFLRADGRIYKLKNTRGIGNYDRITPAYPNRPVTFSATFEKLPAGTNKIDIIEGISGSWNFYGVMLAASHNTSGTGSKKFRVDYSHVAVYGGKEWSDWKEGDNTFVLNYNSKGDIMHIKGGGAIVYYRRISGATEGYLEGDHYQIVSAIDEDGDVFKLQIFDNMEVGLKMIYTNLIVQFSKQ